MDSTKFFTQGDPTVVAHALSALRLATTPQEKVFQRLASIDTMLPQQTIEENIEEAVAVSNFSQLINPTPFKTSPNHKPIQTFSHSIKIPIFPKVLPQEQLEFSATQSLSPEAQMPDILQKSSSSPSASANINAFNNLKSLEEEEDIKPDSSPTHQPMTPTRGILKTGDKSRFANVTRGYSLPNSWGNTSKVIIISDD